MCTEATEEIGGARGLKLRHGGKGEEVGGHDGQPLIRQSPEYRTQRANVSASTEIVVRVAFWGHLECPSYDHALADHAGSHGTGRYQGPEDLRKAIELGRALAQGP